MTDSMAALLADKMPAQPLAPAAMEPCVAGFADIYPCANVDLLSFTPLSAFSSSGANDIWGWTDPSTSNEYALLGLSDGTAFVDITDPVNPIYLGKLPTHTFASSWRDVKVYADHAFIVSEAGGHGMQIFDLTQLRNVVGPPVTFSNTAHFNGFGSAHNVVINEASGYAYGVGASTCSGGLHMVDISTPTSPGDAGCFASDGYTHDAQCVIYNGPDTEHVGSEICLNANEDTLTIVDVTNKAAPAQLSRTGYAGVGYTHQGWLTDDHAYFLLDDETDEQGFGHNTRTRIFDVANLDDPQLIGVHDGVTPAIDHNMYVHDGVLFQANYRSGLRVLDLADVANGNLSELAYFDIFPGSDSASFNGAWSVYPYFASGSIIVSGMEQGLFVLDLTAEGSFNLSASETNLAVCSGNAAATVLNLSSTLNFTDPVTLSAMDLPAGSSAAFADNPVTPPNTTVMTVTVNNTAAGSYPFAVMGSGGAITATADLDLTVDVSPPLTPSLTAPANGAGNVAFQPVLSWNGVANAATYLVELATDAALTNVVISQTTEATSLMVPIALNPNTEYFWRVTAQNSCGSGPESTVYDFTTQDAEALSCDAAVVAFADGIPPGWSVVDNSGGSGIVWTTTADTANCGFGNETGGSGAAACADSDAAGFGAPPFDTELVSNMIALSEATIVHLDFNARYRDLNQGSNDRFEVDMWDGSSWQNLLTWDESHTAEAVALSSLTTAAMTQFRFRYLGNGFDWYAQVDDVSVSCSAANGLYLPVMSRP